MTESLESLPLFARLASSEIPNACLSGAANGIEDAAPFADQVRGFDRFGHQTVETSDGGIPYYVNEFWTAGQRQAHSIHEISYRACFKAQLPEFFISRLTSIGDWVYDPFMGRGTTLVEANRLGRSPAGNDINPLSVLLTRPRLRPVRLSAVEQVLRAVDWNDDSIDEPDLLVFYSNRTLRQISALRRWLLKNAPINIQPDPAIDWVRMIALNRLTGHSSGFFSVYTLPPNQAVSIEAQKKINKKRNQTPPDRDVVAIIQKKTRTLLSDGAPQAAAEFALSTAVADFTPSIATGSAALVVTSPPFLDIVQYREDNWLRCWFAGIDVENVAIAHHRTAGAWQSMVRNVLSELARIVRPGGHVAFEVGEVRKGRVLLERLVWEAAEGLPFKRMFVMVNQQEFTKTANCWGVSNNKSGTNTNRIVILRRSVG